jgi:hypothetical protein
MFFDLLGKIGKVVANYHNPRKTAFVAHSDAVRTP